MEGGVPAGRAGCEQEVKAFSGGRLGPPHPPSKRCSWWLGDRPPVCLQLSSHPWGRATEQPQSELPECLHEAAAIGLGVGVWEWLEREEGLGGCGSGDRGCVHHSGTPDAGRAPSHSACISARDLEGRADQVASLHVGVCVCRVICYCFNSLFLLPQLEPSPCVTHSAHISGERGTNGVPNKPPGDGLCVRCPPVFRGQVTGCVKGKGLRDGPRGAPQALASYLGQQLWVLTGMWAATPTRAGGKTLYQEHADTAKIFSLGKEKETYGFCITECQKVMRFL